MFIPLVIVAFLCAFFYVLQKCNYWARKGVTQHITWSPLGAISDNVLQRKSMAQVLDELYRKYSNEQYFGIYTFLQPVLVLRDPELIKIIAVKNAESFAVHKIFSNGDEELAFSNNLFSTQSGKKWKKTRTSLTPIFTKNKLRLVFALIAKFADNWRKTLDIKSGEIKTFNLKNEVFNRFTNDVVANFVFGMDCDSFADRDNEFYKRSLELTDFGGTKIFGVFGYCFNRFLVKLFNLQIVTKENEVFFSKIVNDIMSIRRKSSFSRPDMLNYFIEVQNKNENSPYEEIITDQDITGHSLLMISAGTDTSATNLNYFAYELAVNPDVQTKLYAEIKSAMDSTSGNLDYETLLSMTYLDMVVSECLRKWPPLPVTDRCNERLCTVKVEEGKYLKLDKGSVLWIPIMSIQRDKTFFPEPEKFDPERFSEENKGSLRKDCYMPFGVGPRACIGARLAILMMKSIIVQILQDYELVAVENTPKSIQLSNRDIFIHPQTPLYVGLKKR